MSFKENLLKKIKIDDLTRMVVNSIGVDTGGRNRVDRDSMREMLELCGYPHMKNRDLELYILEDDATKKNILVFDNDLTVYHTTVEDVIMRKSPTTKEMLNVRNVMKILNDKDVVVSKKEETARRIREKCVGTLDLSYDAPDIEGIARDGIGAFENGETDGVRETLTLFEELLGFTGPPKGFQVKQMRVTGRRSPDEAGNVLYGPIVMFDPDQNILKMVTEPVSNADKEELKRIQDIAAGKKDAPVDGYPVFQELKKMVLAEKPAPA